MSAVGLQTNRDLMLIKKERKEWFKYLNIYPYEVKSPRL